MPMAFVTPSAFASAKQELAAGILKAAADVASKFTLRPFQPRHDLLSVNLEELATELLCHGANVWPETAREEGDVAETPPHTADIIPLMRRVA